VSAYKAITFPAWFQPAVSLAYKINFDNIAILNPTGNFSLTANNSFTWLTFNYTNTLQHQEFATSIQMYASVATSITVMLIIDGITYLSKTFSVGTTAANYNFSNIFNLPIGSHSCQITLTAAANITLTVQGTFYTGLGNLILGSTNGNNPFALRTLSGSEINSIKIYYTGIGSGGSGTLSVKSKNNIIILISTTSMPGAGITSSALASYPSNYELGDGDTTQQINIQNSGTIGDTNGAYLLIPSVVINEASTIIQNYSLGLASGLT
jgi:hypothetical protein